MYGYIYKTTNLINGKIYIGQHKSEEYDSSYYGSGKLIIRAIEKYGIENFSNTVLCCCDSKQELNKMEKQLIKNYNSRDIKIGYNISFGGDGGDTFTGLSDKEKQIRRIKISENNSGRIIINNGEHQKYVKENELDYYLNNGYVKGYLHTPERDRVRSEAKKKFHREHPEFRNSGMFKKGICYYNEPRTEETKEKLRQANLGKKQSEETRNKRSKSMKARYDSGYVSPLKGKPAYNKGKTGQYKWVTDGITNKYIDINNGIPDGFHLGRTFNRYSKRNIE